MPWKETEPVDERLRFISAYLEEEETFSELCEQFEISRKTGYKWVNRYNEKGIQGLAELSRAPENHPNATESHIVEIILDARRRHPLWGPKKLLVVLERHFPRISFPSGSTVGEILRRNRMISPRRRKRRSSPHREPLRAYDHPNTVWCADFKGHFVVGGRRCHPLTVSDGYSRYLLGCTALHHPRTGQCRRAFESIFREYGLPDFIRTDNGPPFSTVAPGGLSQLAVWWIRLGIRPERIMPARPDQNGRHERMHRTLKAATASPPRNSFRAQQRAFDAFRTEFNEVRPHEALGQKVPADIYKPSPRSFPAKLPALEYPDHFELRRTYPNGVISFAGTQWYVSGALREQWLGLQSLNEGRWKVFFGPIELGIADIANAKKRGYRHFSLLVPTGREAWHGNSKPPGRKHAQL
jgi:transposase InsO family protein